MKNIVKICITMMMVLAMTVPTFAGTFVPSISQKDSPDLVIMGEDEYGAYYGVVVDKDGNVVLKLYEGDIIVTPLSEIDGADIPQEHKDQLKKVYQDYLDGKASLEDVEGLLELVKDALGDEATTDDITIRDLFDVTVTNPEALELLEGDYNLVITFDLNYDADELLAVMTYLEQWGLIYDFTVNEDGTVTLTLDNQGPVAFLAAGLGQYADGSDIPETGDTTNIALWAGLGIGAAALLLLLMRRRQDEA